MDKKGSPINVISAILVADTPEPARMRSVTIDPKIKAGQELSVRDLTVGHWKNDKGSGLCFTAESVFEYSGGFRTPIPIQFVQ